MTDIGELTTKSCHRIAKECINLRCFITIESPFASGGFSQLTALHNRIRSVRINIKEPFEMDYSKIFAAMVSCGSIEDLKVHNQMGENNTTIPYRFTRALFPKSGCSLKTFISRPPVYCQSDSILHIAKSTGKLQILRLSCLFPIDPVPFETICSANHQLEDISILESRPTATDHAGEERTCKLVKELVRATTPCKYLKYFSLQFQARTRPEYAYLRDAH